MQEKIDNNLMQKKNQINSLKIFVFFFILIYFFSKEIVFAEEGNQEKCAFANSSDLFSKTKEREDKVECILNPRDCSQDSERARKSSKPGTATED